VSAPPLALIGSAAISSLLWTASQVPPAWGIFDQNNNQVLFPDSVLEFSYRKAYNLPTFPVQQGQFSDYNKVTQPAEIRVRFSKGGSVQDRTAFLLAATTIEASISLYSIVIPEASYDGFNCSRCEIVRRGAGGAFFLTEVDMFFTEIQQISAQYTNVGVNLPNAQSASAQPIANQGNVQLQAPTSAETLAAQNALGSVNFP
jgi:hypothetical protein